MTPAAAPATIDGPEYIAKHLAFNTRRFRESLHELYGVQPALAGTAGGPAGTPHPLVARAEHEFRQLMKHGPESAAAEFRASRAREVATVPNPERQKTIDALVQRVAHFGKEAHRANIARTGPAEAAKFLREQETAMLAFGGRSRPDATRERSATEAWDQRFAAVLDNARARAHGPSEKRAEQLLRDPDLREFLPTGERARQLVDNLLELETAMKQTRGMIDLGPQVPADLPDSARLANLASPLTPKEVSLLADHTAPITRTVQLAAGRLQQLDREAKLVDETRADFERALKRMAPDIWKDKDAARLNVLEAVHGSAGKGIHADPEGVVNTLRQRPEQFGTVVGGGFFGNNKNAARSAAAALAGTGDIFVRARAQSLGPVEPYTTARGEVVTTRAAIRDAAHTDRRSGIERLDQISRQIREAGGLAAAKQAGMSPPGLADSLPVGKVTAPQVAAR